jgi:hypothetical protein
MPGLLKRLQIRAPVGRYDNSIPDQFLAPHRLFKIPALYAPGSLISFPSLPVIGYYHHTLPAFSFSDLPLYGLNP